MKPRICKGMDGHWRIVRWNYLRPGTFSFDVWKFDSWEKARDQVYRQAH
jgi:hypothetical protein